MVKPVQRKLNLGRYPYTYVRTVVMKAMLLQKEDYHKLLKMSFSEIARFLQDTNYKKEISEFATEHSGADLLELALNKSLSESFKKLMRISPDELGLVIREYAKRRDIEDIKTIIRGKFTKTDDKLILNSITAAGTLSLKYLTELIKKNSIEDVLKGSKIMDFSLLSKGIIYLREKNSLAMIENELDRHYYNTLVKFSKKLPQGGTLFRNFLAEEVEILNILTLLRLKKSKIENASDFIITAQGLISPKIAGLAGAGDIDSLTKALEQTHYKGVIEKGIEDFKINRSLITLETALYRHWLKESALFLHQHPLSVDVILGYMLAKDVETRNLRILIKGKQLGLGNDFIENQLVF